MTFYRNKYILQNNNNTTSKSGKPKILMMPCEGNYCVAMQLLCV